MPIEIVRLLGFEGPNLHSPQPGVFLQVRTNKDRSRRLQEALKDAGQGIGIVIGYLDINAEREGDQYLISASFTTPTPKIGIELARYVVTGLNAKEAGDEEWDAEGALWDLQKRRRAEAIPLGALQLIAEASSRGVPSFIRDDGQLQLGYGARSLTRDLASFKKPGSPGAVAADEISIGAAPFAQAAESNEIPWEQLGPIPIFAIAGGPNRDSAAELIAATLDTHGQRPSLVGSADFAATQRLLADQDTTLAVVGLTAEGIAERGLAFPHCAYSAVTDLPNELPHGIANPEELARVLGVAMLVTDAHGRVVLNADVPEIAALAEYAPCPVVYISTRSSSTTLAIHCANGGLALFIRDGSVVAASGTSEQAVASATLPEDQLPGALAALALLWSAGLSWAQIIVRGAQ